jgi:hypothetical protein
MALAAMTPQEFVEAVRAIPAPAPALPGHTVRAKVCYLGGCSAAPSTAAAFTGIWLDRPSRRVLARLCPLVAAAAAAPHRRLSQSHSASQGVLQPKVPGRLQPVNSTRSSRGQTHRPSRRQQQVRGNPPGLSSSRSSSSRSAGCAAPAARVGHPVEQLRQLLEQQQVAQSCCGTPCC